MFHYEDLNFKYPETLYETIFLHGGLLLSLMIEWMLNSRLFTLPRSYIYLAFIMIIYLHIYYATYDFAGFLPYYPILSFTYWDFLIIGIALSVAAIFSFASGILTNIVKGGFTVSNPMTNNLF